MIPENAYDFWERCDLRVTFHVLLQQNRYIPLYISADAKYVSKIGAASKRLPELQIVEGPHSTNRVF